MPVAYGQVSFAQIGRETAGNYGVAAAATKKLGLKKYTPRHDIGVFVSETLGGSWTAADFRQGLKVFEFDLEFEASYTEHLMLIDALMGTATYGSNGGITTGAAPYVHTFIEREFLNSFTVQVVTGNIPAGKCYRYLGAKPVGFTFSGRGGPGMTGLCTFVWKFIAQTFQTNQTPTTLSFGTPAPIYMDDIVTVDNGTADTGVKLREFSLEVDNGGAKDRFNAVGLAGVDEPIRDKQAITRLSMTCEYQALTLDSAAQALTAGSPQIILGLSTAIFNLELPVAYLPEDPAQAIEGPGIMLQKLVWQAAYDSATALTGLKLIVTNTQATITT